MVKIKATRIGGFVYYVAPSFSGAIFYVDTASTAGGNGTSSATVGANRAFPSLKTALEDPAINAALASTPVKINCVGVAADTQECTQTTWTNITNCTASRYLEIWGDNRSAKYNTTKYRIEPAVNISAIYGNEPPFVWMYFIQAKVSSNNASVPIAFRLSTNNVGTGGSGYDCGFFGCIAQLSRSGAGRPVGFYDSAYDGTGTIKRHCCIAYETAGTSGCVGFDGDHPSIENDSCLSNCGYYDFACGAGATHKNCVSVGGAGAGGFLEGTLINCASADSSAGAGGNKNFASTFLDLAAHDYRLQPTDTQLKGQGNTTLTLDIDGQTRSAPHDIGPDDQQETV